MSIKKTKNGTYHLKVYIPNEVQPKLGLGAYYEKRFKTRREAKEAELKLSVDIEKAKLNKHLINTIKSLSAKKIFFSLTSIKMSG